MLNKQGALQQYQSIGAHGSVQDADPHRLIQMLMEGTLEKIAKAKFYMEKNNLAEKGVHISWAISIIGGLRDSLDLEQGGDIAQNLDALYAYMIGILTDANINNKTAQLDEVSNLMREVKAGWDGIREQAVKAYQDTTNCKHISAQ